MVAARGRLAGALAYAAYPFPSVYAQQLLTEPLATFLVLFGARAAVQIWAERFLVPGHALLAGALCVAPALVKSNHVCLFAAVMLLGLWVVCHAGSRRKMTVLSLALLLVGAGMVMAPWGVRNISQFGKPYLLGKSTAGRALLIAQYETRGQWVLWRFWDEKSSGSRPEFQEFREKDRRAEKTAREQGIDAGILTMTLAWQEIRRDPREAIRGYLVRAYSFWLRDPH